MPSTAKFGILQFGDGARDARRAEPFLGIAERACAAASDCAGELAYLASMPPDLKAGVQRLVARGVTRAHVVTFFLAGGEHVRRDVPEFVRNPIGARADLEIDLAEPAGANDSAVAAIATYRFKRN